MIDPQSRYANAPRCSLTRPDGTEQSYLLPPILPHPDDHTLAQIHTVSDSDRPDTLAARAYGQATAWWMLCNANSAPHPDQLCDPVGVRRVIPRPEGGEAR